MTVRESLQFQASLRLGHLSKAEKTSRVEEILKEVGEAADFLHFRHEQLVKLVTIL